MRLFSDTWTMTTRSLRHIVRSPDTIITVVAMPIALMLLFVYVFGGSFGHIFTTGPVKYIDFIIPGVVAMTVVSGIAYAAVRLSMDMQQGLVNRFRTMPIASSSILGGHAVSSLLSNLFSVLLVVLIGVLVGFRSHAGAVEWLLFVALTMLFTWATTWLALMFGLLAKTVEAAAVLQLHLVAFSLCKSQLCADGEHERASTCLRRTPAHDADRRYHALAARVRPCRKQRLGRVRLVRGPPGRMLCCRSAFIPNTKKTGDRLRRTGARWRH